MNKVADFITEEIFKFKEPLTIDVFSEVLKTIPHLRNNDEFMFTEDEARKIRKVIGFFVSTQFGDHLMKQVGILCRGEKGTPDKININLAYFQTVSDIRTFIEVCNILDVHVDTTSIGEYGPAFVIRKQEDFGRG